MEKETGGSGGSLDPPGPLLTHLHTVCMAFSECLPTRFNPLAERTCFSQVSQRTAPLVQYLLANGTAGAAIVLVEGSQAGLAMGRGVIRRRSQ